MLAGLPQRGAVIGSERAPVTLTEYIDVQSRPSRAYSSDVVPALMARYVRTGRLRVARRVVSVIDGSEEATAWSTATVGESAVFTFTELLLRNQGEVEGEYLSAGLLRAVARASGLSPARLQRLATGYRARSRVATDSRRFKALALDTTPALTVGPTGGGAPRAVWDLSVDGIAREIARERGRR